MLRERVVQRRVERSPRSHLLLRGRHLLLLRGTARHPRSPPRVVHGRGGSAHRTRFGLLKNLVDRAPEVEVAERRAKLVTVQLEQANALFEVLVHALETSQVHALEAVVQRNLAVLPASMNESGCTTCVADNRCKENCETIEDTAMLPASKSLAA